MGMRSGQMKLDLSLLNETQYDAVVTTEGPVMVMAGAGSGKTRVLTHRIAYLIDEIGIPSKNILAVTFTNKAAREMKERVAKLINTDTTHMWISTFHAFCARVLRAEISKLPPYTNKFIIIDEDDSLKIIRELLKKLDIDSKEFRPQYVKKCISNKKNLDNYKAKEETVNQIKRIEKAYNEYLEKENLVDFDDLIILVIRLFTENKQILEKYQNKFQYIMIDEFQDTNTKQYQLIYLLGINHHNIFVVGDQDQSIYSFRGAKIENINLFRKDFLETKVILLERNYRSTSSILNVANEVISNNKGRIKKNLYTTQNEGQKPVYYNAESSYAEVMFVIDKIKELHLSGYDWQDFAIMYRANSLSRSFEDALVRYQIPYTIYGGLSFFARKEVKDMIAYVRLMLNHDDDFSFKRIVNEPKRKIGEDVIDKLSTTSFTYNLSLFDSIDHANITGTGYTNLLAFRKMINETLEELETIELMDIIDKIAFKSGYYEMLKKLGEEGEDRLLNIRELKSVFKEADEFYEGSKVEKLEALLSDLALRTDTDNQRDDANVVKLMTYHQAKGLEFRVVFMVATEEGIFPSFNSVTEEERQEERRICYVGITRAMEKLYITNAYSRNLYGQTSYQAPSCFIKEMKIANLNVVGRSGRREDFINLSNTTSSSSSPSLAKSVSVTSADLKVGDKINHKAFGDGLIVACNEGVIEVAFKAPHGIKKLISTHPSIRKIEK